MQLQSIDQIPCKVEYLDCGDCAVTFNISEKDVIGFVTMLNGLTGLFRSLNWKAKTNIDSIRSRLYVQKTEQEKLVICFENDACRMYTDFFEREQNSRLALSLTVSKIKNQYDFSSYDIIKNCLTKNKLLKKTGFYKSRHKIE